MPRTLDHVVLCVRDLDAARATYSGLGFTLTPKATHPFGTNNSLIQFAGHNFLELVAIGDRAAIPPPAPGRFRFAAACDDFLRRRGEGMAMLVFTGTDARADVAGFAARGLDTYEPLDFGRDAILPDCSVARVGFSLAFATTPALPGLAFFTSQQHHPPELFWKPEYQAHANGALRLVEVSMTAPDPAALAGFFQRLTQDETTLDADGTLHVGPPADRITVRRDPGEPRFVSLRLSAKRPPAIPAAIPAAAAHGIEIVIDPEAPSGR